MQAPVDGSAATSVLEMTFMVRPARGEYFVRYMYIYAYVHEMAGGMFVHPVQFVRIACGDELIGSCL